MVSKARCHESKGEESKNHLSYDHGKYINPKGEEGKNNLSYDHEKYITPFRGLVDFAT